jgi:hypothetical protein
MNRNYKKILKNDNLKNLLLKINNYLFNFS